MYSDADKCSSNPCKYGGKCVDADSYNCQCAPGYEGKHCDHSKSICVYPYIYVRYLRKPKKQIIFGGGFYPDFF